MYSLVMPLQVILTPEDGVGAHVTPPFENPDKFVGLHKVITMNQNNKCGTYPPPELSAQPQPRGVHSGYHRRILSYEYGGFSPMASPPNPTVVFTVTYEYLFYLSSSEQLRPPAQRKAWGYYWGLIPWVP
jgi:hypothetical protein